MLTDCCGVCIVLGMKRINSAKELNELAKELRVRPDWHEPDEQEVNARIIGSHLDNAMGADPEADQKVEVMHSSDGSVRTLHWGEYNVVITKKGKDVAVVNLAELLAWGCKG